MILKKEYRFPHDKFDEDATNTFNGEFFLDFLKACEGDFHEDFPMFFANYLMGNGSTMHLLRRSFRIEEDEYFGMEMTNGQIDYDAGLELDKFSKTKTVYAIESYEEDNKEAPLFLIIDDTLKDGRLVLKYIPDDEDKDEEQGEPVPQGADVVTSE
jgi:hypothetical protein